MLSVPDKLRLRAFCRGNLGAKIYLMFAGCMLVHFLIAFFAFPELKGRTAAEIDEMFEARLPARKFKGKKQTISMPR